MTGNSSPKLSLLEFYSFQNMPVFVSSCLILKNHNVLFCAWLSKLCFRNLHKLLIKCYNHSLVSILLKRNALFQAELLWSHSKTERYQVKVAYHFRKLKIAIKGAKREFITHGVKNNNNKIIKIMLRQIFRIKR